MKGPGPQMDFGGGGIWLKGPGPKGGGGRVSGLKAGSRKYKNLGLRGG